MRETTPRATSQVLDVTDAAVAAGPTTVVVMSTESVLLHGLALLFREEGLDVVVVAADDRDPWAGALPEGRLDAVVIDGRMGADVRRRWCLAARQCCPDVRVAVVDVDGGAVPGGSGREYSHVDLDLDPRQLFAWLRRGRDDASSPAPVGPRAVGGTPGVAERLTARELEVLRSLMGGHSSTAVAQSLSISPHTVRTHVQNILAKLGVRTRHEAAALAFGAGLRPSEAVSVVVSRT